MNYSRAGLPGTIDINIPNVARVYDFFLGGAHNFASDRMLAATVERTMAGLHFPDAARLNRAFLGRAVQFMIESGIRQFLDIGSGIPTVGNVHEIAQAADPECRVVYVDKDPVAVAHSQFLLADNDKAAAIQADIRDPGDILDRTETRRLVDFGEPVGLLTLLLWHFIPDSDDPVGLVACYRDKLAPGSYFALTHLTGDGDLEGFREAIEEARRRRTDVPTPRSHEQVVGLFAGFDLVEPGIVDCASWRPTGPVDFSSDPDANSLLYVGVGRKPGAPE